MDYRLTDPYLDPPGENDACYAEQSIRLPDTFWCYDPLADQPLVNDLPALANGFITFGCLNNFCKVNDGVLMLWAKVLRCRAAVASVAAGAQGQARDHVLAVLRREGIDEPRVELVDQQPRQQYLQLYHRIDVGLDPLPYNGHTTSLDAFWMGVPTLTLMGKTVVGRAGWSQLCNLGLKELAATTPEAVRGIGGRAGRRSAPAARVASNLAAADGCLASHGRQPFRTQYGASVSADVAQVGIGPGEPSPVRQRREGFFLTVPLLSRMEVFVFSPKGINSKAQGKRSATLGKRSAKILPRRG